MTTYNPIFRSPIAVPDYKARPELALEGLGVSDQTGAPVMLIQGPLLDLKRAKKYLPAPPTTPGELVEARDNSLVACLTPREYYWFGRNSAANLPSAEALELAFKTARVTDYTHGTAIVRLVGPPAPEMLAKICGLNFQPNAFPDRLVKQSSAAKIKTLIARYDEDNTPAYYLHVARSFGQYFWDVVWDAGQEFGIVAF